MNTRTLQKLVEISHELVNVPTTLNRHISFIIRKNAILAIGFSQLKTSPLALKYHYKWGALHSELDAIRRLPLPFSYLTKCSLVNIRVNTLKEICNSKPCRVCLRLIEQADFRTVYFTNSDGSFSRL